jgi:hypothetical protein
MKVSIPLNLKHQARLYYELSKRGAQCSGKKNAWPYEKVTEEELLSIAVRQARYDPRLMEILVGFFSTFRPVLNPCSLKENLRRVDALQAMAVIGEFALTLTDDQHISDLFDFLSTGVDPVPLQLFYRGLYRVGGKKIDDVITKPLRAFKKWGFLAADPPFNKDKNCQQRIYLYDQDSRLNILRDLSSNQKKFRLHDYLEKLRFSVSRQQALQDIKSVEWIDKRGIGKGTHYKRVSV